MTTSTEPTTIKRNTATTTPPCPPWCTGDGHVGGTVSGDSAERYVDANGEHLPDGVSASIRDHETGETGGAWLLRSDALLPDGTWRVGRCFVGVTSDDDLTPALAEALAHRLLHLVAQATR